MDARVALAFAFAVLWTATNIFTVAPRVSRACCGVQRPVGIVLLLFQTATWISALVLLPQTQLVLYAECVTAVWTVWSLTALVFKHLGQHTTRTRVVEPLVTSWFAFTGAQTQRWAEMDAGPAVPATGARTNWSDAWNGAVKQWEDAGTIARRTLKFMQPEVEIAGPRQLMHLTYFGLLVLWTIAVCAWDTTLYGTASPTNEGFGVQIWLETAALGLAAVNWIMRSQMNLKSEQLGIVRQIRRLPGAALACRLSPLNAFGVCALSVSNAVSLWPDAAGALVYLSLAVFLPLFFCVVYHLDVSPFELGETWLTRFEDLVAPFFELRALNEGAFWTWVFLVDLTGWSPNLAYRTNFAGASTSLGAVFAAIAAATFFVELVDLFRPSTLYTYCARGNM